MRDKFQWRISPSLLIVWCCALLTWMIFYPGLFSVDSLNIYQQALTGDFKNFHPPLLALALRFFFRVGGTVGLFTLLACLLGFLGIRRLSLALTKYFSINENKGEWIVCLVILVLVSPLTPMVVYFATLWTDTWLTISLIWIIAMVLEMTMDKNRMGYVRLVSLTLLIIFAVLVRSNSIILYPPLILVLVSILRNKSISRAGMVFLALCPLVCYFIFVHFEYKVLRTMPVHPERVVYALDLGSMLFYEPAICETIYLRSCDVVYKNFPPDFVVGHGAIDYTFNQGLSRINPGFTYLLQQPFLSEDLWLAIKKFPHIYVVVKVLNFWDYIHARNQYYYQSFIHPNGFGVALNSRFGFLRKYLFDVLHAVYAHPILKYFSFVHLTWIVVNLLGIIYCFANRRKSERLRYLGLIMLVPATYYFSYLIALTASDFRFMYPSLVIMQIIALNFLFACPVKNSGYWQRAE